MQQSEHLPREGDWRGPTAASFSTCSNTSPPGDVVTVKRIDRLARSTLDLFGIVERIVDANAQSCPVAESWADGGASTGRLMIAVLGGLLDVERDLIRTRTAEGQVATRTGQAHTRAPVADGRVGWRDCLSSTGSRPAASRSRSGNRAGSQPAFTRLLDHLF
jgi:hypothetical protein